jgi:chemotaxis signal transduction protein
MNSGRLPQPDRPELALAEPDHALVDYLQNLLNEVPLEPSALPKPVVARPVPTRLLEVTPVAPPVARPQPAPAVAPEKLAGPQIPTWADESFQILYFRAGNAQLSLPLLALRRIVRLDATLTRLPGVPAWHLGLQLVRGEKVAVADLARLLYPGSAVQDRDRDAYLLLLDELPWGLTCQSLGEARRLAPDAVRWRRGSDPGNLVQGVIREGLTPLLSGPALRARLAGR